MPKLISGLSDVSYVLPHHFLHILSVLSLSNQVFELLTGRWLFHPSGGATWSIVDDHLSKMQELMGETFSADLLNRARERKEFFNDSGKGPPS